MQAKYRLEFSVGIGEDKNHVPLEPETVSWGFHNAMLHLTQHFGGCTVLEGQGSYTAQDGRIVWEKSVTFITYADADKALNEAFLRGVQHAIRDFYKQESCLLVRLPAFVSFGL